MTNIFYLVGCGNIGSRHLQALIKLPGEMVVHIVEPNPRAQALANKRLEEIKSPGNAMEIIWHDTLPVDTTKSDLVIVATSATGRVGIVRDLLLHGHDRFLIEKMVCQSQYEYEQLISEMNRHNAEGWVNAPRRYFDFYRELRESYFDGDMLRLFVVGGNAGLGCNAIHFLDLFLWLSDEYQISLNGDYLYPELFNNKRGSDLVEFAGTIIGKTPKGNIVTITFMPFDSPDVVSISGKHGHVIVDETGEQVTVVQGLRKMVDLRFQNQYVSQTTTAIVADILKDDTCDLPTLEDSARVHSELFRIFNHHIEKLTGQRPQLCPIT